MLNVNVSLRTTCLFQNILYRPVAEKLILSIINRFKYKYSLQNSGTEINSFKSNALGMLKPVAQLVTKSTGPISQRHWVQIQALPLLFPLLISIVFALEAKGHGFKSKSCLHFFSSQLHLNEYLFVNWEKIKLFILLLPWGPRIIINGFTFRMSMV